MSYARSPRPVCSITIGTSIIFGSFKFTCHTPAPTTVAPAGEDRKWSALRGLVIQQVEGLLVADSVSNPIERPITCQTSPYRLRGLLRLRSQSLDFMTDFLVALSRSQAVQVHLFHVFRPHALGRQRAQAALQPNIDLPVHHGLGNVEVVPFHKFGDQLVLGLMFGGMFFLRLHVLADPLLEVVDPA